jgi:aryl-alcohol dehydrogenase-like predicted oxidoreductase
VTHSKIKMFGVGSIPWSPLARGALTRPLGQQTSRGQIDWQVFQYLHGVSILITFYRFIGNYAQASSYETIISRYAGSLLRKTVIHRFIRVEELAKKKGVTMAQIAIAWILTKEGKLS